MTAPNDCDGAAPQGAYNFELQRLRILSCTARAMASSAGGLRFKLGARPWLPGQAHEELVPGRRQPGQPRPVARCWSANDQD